MNRGEGEVDPQQASSSAHGHTEEDEARSEAEVLFALQHRPRLSIRARILFGFMLLVLLSLGEDIANLLSLRSVSDKLEFLLIAERFTADIQQARRYEKNYFLYGTGLEDALRHAESADSLLASQAEPLSQVAGRDAVSRLREHSNSYVSLLHDLRNGPDPPPVERARVEPLLREHGSSLVLSSFDLARRERENVRRVLRRAEWAPWVFVTLLVALSLYMSVFLWRPIITRLRQLMGATERIAQGDFTPITPVRRYRDEISNLTIAMNRMMHDLKHHEEVMIQSHKLRAVGTLTAGIAHELNNPLNNITLTASVLEDQYRDMDDSQRLELVRDLTSEADRAQVIVRNLLDFAREGEKSADRFDLVEVLREAGKLLQNQVKLQKVKAEFKLPEGTVSLHGDRQQLCQVFVNLVMNALDVLAPGGTVAVSVHRDRQPGYVAVDVRDDGPGIPPHILPNIFDPFFTTKPTGKGTGLGLSVSLGIVKRHGGDITVKSTPGKGTTFHVVLPVSEIPA